jgi:hypothetical protein
VSWKSIVQISSSQVVEADKCDCLIDESEVMGKGRCRDVHDLIFIHCLLFSRPELCLVHVCFNDAIVVHLYGHKS